MARERVDWEGLLAQVRAAAAGASAADEGPELAARARALARPAQVADRGTGLEVLRFTLSHSRFALPTRHVLEVLRLTGYTPVPRTPEFVLGVTNLRGEILPIFDLRRALWLSAVGITDLSRLLVLGRDLPEFALVVDRVHDVLELDERTLVRPDLPERGATPYVRAVAPDGTAVLDGDAVLDDPRLYVAVPPEGISFKERS